MPVVDDMRNYAGRLGGFLVRPGETASRIIAGEGDFVTDVLPFILIVAALQNPEPVARALSKLSIAPLAAFGALVQAVARQAVFTGVGLLLLTIVVAVLWLRSRVPRERVFLAVSYCYLPYAALAGCAALLDRAGLPLFFLPAEPFFSFDPDPRDPLLWVLAGVRAAGYFSLPLYYLSRAVRGMPHPPDAAPIEMARGRPERPLEDRTPSPRQAGRGGEVAFVLAFLSLTAPLAIDMHRLGQSWERLRPVTTGETAPRFRVRDLDGHSIELARLAGRPVVLAFFATWCVPCRAELPGLENLHQEFGDKVTFVALSRDDPDMSAEVRAFAKELGLTFNVALDDVGIGRRYRVDTLPTLFVLDGAGVVRYATIGVTTEWTLRRAINAVLGEE